MGIGKITATLAEAPTLLHLAMALKTRPPSERDCFAARVASTAAQFPARTAVTFEGQSRSWRELNEQANRYAAALRALGLKRGDAASLMMENRIEFLAIVIALNKLGVTAALINTNLTGAALAHCIGITGSRLCIFGEERLQAIAQVKAGPALSKLDGYLYVEDRGATGCPTWARDLDEESEHEGSDNPAETAQVELGDIAFYIFTSGTTGLPKAALLSNQRFLLTATLAWKAGLRCDVNDCIYLCLPLYHGTGLFLGVGAAFCSGAAMFIRRRFSAGNFLPEVREHGATCLIYIGELCRYLLSTPERPDDFRNPLATVMGNGLRPDIWHAFKRRFGIGRISEFYGSSEGNIGFLNILNRDCTIGTTTLPHALVKYDVDSDAIVRDSRGRCIRVAQGEPGLLLGKISAKTVFEGYTSAEATEKKIIRDVFHSGDAWFNTGDLIRRIEVGFALGLPHYQFVDRVGDTFRWKSENVSTHEVGEILNSHPQVALSNVYGVKVPGADGRAGMAALVLAQGVAALDLADFSRHVNRALPPYARPLFLRILPQMDTTGTFKMMKGDLRREGFDPSLVDDALYVMKPGASSYEPLEQAYVRQILAGEAGY